MKMLDKDKHAYDHLLSVYWAETFRKCSHAIHLFIVYPQQMKKSKVKINRSSKGHKYAHSSKDNIICV